VNQTYEVQPRDTLDGIGAQFDVRWQCLAEVNSIENVYTDLKPGMVLTIDFSCPRYEGLDFVANPREGATVPIESLGQGGGAATDAPAPGPDDTTYTVREAQTLDTIAQELDISVISLQIANGLGPSDRIFPGQTLVIPAGAPAYGVFPPLANPIQGANRWLTPSRVRTATSVRGVAAAVVKNMSCNPGIPLTRLALASTSRRPA